MKKIFIILSLFLNLTLYANNIELTKSEKQYLLDWTSKYCDENHKNYESLSKDRFFICKQSEHSNFGNYPDGLYGTLSFYEVGIDDRTKKEIIFFGVLYAIFVGLATALYFITENTKSEKATIARRKRIFLVKIPATIIASLILLVGFNIYEVLKTYSTNTIRNGNVKSIKVALPIYNILGLHETPLVLAVSSGSLEAVKYMVEEKKYNPNQTSKDKFGNKTDPFDLALRNKSHEISNYLKQYLPVDKPIAIATASKSFDIELLKKSVKLKKPTSSEILNAFIVSIIYEDNKAMKYLYSLDNSIIDKKGDISFAVEAIPIKVAIKANNYGAVEFLVSNGLNINECGTLSTAAYYDRLEIFSFLIANGGNIYLECKDEYDNVFIQASRGQAKKIQKLMNEKGWKMTQKMKNHFYKDYI